MDSLFAMLSGSFTRAPWGWGVFAMILLGYWRIKPLMTRLNNEREANLLEERATEMASMRDRIEKLEAAQTAKEAAHLGEVENLKKQADVKAKVHEAERALDRHKIRNLKQCFQSLLMLLKKGVSVEDAVAEVEAMQAEHAAQEAAESAAIHTLAVKAAAA